LLSENPIEKEAAEIMSVPHLSGIDSPITLRRPIAAAVVLLAVLFPAGAAGAWEMETGQIVLPATSIGSSYHSVLF